MRPLPRRTWTRRERLPTDQVEAVFRLMRGCGQRNSACPKRFPVESVPVQSPRPMVMRPGDMGIIVVGFMHARNCY